MSPPKKKPMIDVDGGFSKAAGMLVAILTIVSIICAAVFYIVHQNDMLQAANERNADQIKNNTESIKKLNDWREMDYGNFSRIMKMMELMHERGAK